MPREQSPAFQFYPADFLADHNVVMMSAEARGVYISLLCHCWINGSVPNEPEQLQRLGGWSPHICRQNLAGQWDKIWLSIQPCFVTGSANNRQLINPRIERERDKQATFRAMKKIAGQAGGKQKASNRLAQGVAKASSSSSSSSSSSISDSKVLSNSNALADAASRTSGGGLRANSKRPIFTGQRFVVFEWMLEDINRILGERQTTEFDVHAWFFDLDARIAKTDIVLQRNDTWAWLQTELVNEAIRRGLKVAQPHHPRLGKQSQRLLTAIQNIAATERAAGR